MSFEFELEEEERKSGKRKEPRWNIPIPVSVKGVRRDGTEFIFPRQANDFSDSPRCQFHRSCRASDIESLESLTDHCTRARSSVC